MSNKHRDNNQEPFKTAKNSMQKNDEIKPKAGETASENKEPMEALEHSSYEELEAKLNEAEAKADQYWNQYLRAQADLENVRRRTERDVSSAHKYGAEKLIAELLLVVDSLERGLELTGNTTEGSVKTVRDGMEMTMNMLLKTLEKFGVKQLNPLGEMFNPEWHQAVSMLADPKAKPNTVLQVLQKGYLLHDRLLRPAIVVVAKG